MTALAWPNSKRVEIFDWLSEIYPLNEGSPPRFRFHDPSGTRTSKTFNGEFIDRGNRIRNS